MCYMTNMRCIPSFLLHMVLHGQLIKQYFITQGQTTKLEIQPKAKSTTQIFPIPIIAETPETYSVFKLTQIHINDTISNATQQFTALLFLKMIQDKSKTSTHSFAQNEQPNAVPASQDIEDTSLGSSDQ